MPSIGIETGTWLRGRERELMEAVSKATYAPLGVGAEKNDVVLDCRDTETRLVPRGRSARFCRVEIRMIVGRSDEQKRQLRSSICRALAPFGVPEPDVKLIVTEVRRADLG